MPEILYTSYIGILNGLWVGLLGVLTSSNESNNVFPLYQGILSDLFTMLSPIQPEIGIKGMFSTLYPIYFK